MPDAHTIAQWGLPTIPGKMTGIGANGEVSYTSVGPLGPLSIVVIVAACILILLFFYFLLYPVIMTKVFGVNTDEDAGKAFWKRRFFIPKVPCSGRPQRPTPSARQTTRPVDRHRPSHLRIRHDLEKGMPQAEQGPPSSTRNDFSIHNNVPTLALASTPTPTRLSMIAPPRLAEPQVARLSIDITVEKHRDVDAENKRPTSPSPPEYSAVVKSAETPSE